MIIHFVRNRSKIKIILLQAIRIRVNSDTLRTHFSYCYKAIITGFKQAVKLYSNISLLPDNYPQDGGLFDFPKNYLR
jgi:hypothetical protein